MPRIAVIIPAAGSSSRFREGDLTRSKLDEDLGGRPLVQRTVELFTRNPAIANSVDAIIVAGPHDDEPYADFRLRHADRLALLGATICRGGQHHRCQTIAAALQIVPDSATHVAIHDAARPCTPESLIEKLFRLCQTCPAIIPALPVSETIKRAGKPIELDTNDDPVAAILGVSAREHARPVESTLDRRGLYAVQTPQVFEVSLLRRAYALADTLDPASITDDAMLIEHLAEPVMLIEGDTRNIKVTRPPDITIARALLNLKPPSERDSHKRF